MSSGRFLREFFSKPNVTGAVAPSSTFLARAIVEGLDLKNARAVLEYGPGSGAFTSEILRGLPPASRFLAIEINPRMAELFNARHPQSTLVQDSVANVRMICDSHGIASVDCIISGLPWALFSEELQTTFLDATMSVLKPGGQFVTFGYVHAALLPPGKRFAGVLPRYFGKVSKSPVVWRNVPPAFVYRCTR